jgi:restriction system protein
MFRRKRKRRRRPDSNVILLLAVLLFVVAAYKLPGFGVFAGSLGLGGAATIAWVSASKNSLNASRWRAVGSYFELSPEAFERHVSDTFRYLGYSTQLTPRVGDQGVDVVATRGGEIIAIQVKRFSDRAPNSAVQAVHAGCAHYRANRSILVCLGGFSPSALALARSTNVELIDGRQYADMVRRVAPTTTNRPRFALPSGRALGFFVVLVAVSAVSIGISLAGRALNH